MKRHPDQLRTGRRPAVVLALAGALFAAGPAPVAAEETAFTLDPAASRVTFTLQATLHTVEGSFRVVEGEVRFDPVTGAASGRVMVDAASGDTGNPKRDRDLHRIVLESERHPRAVLAPTRLDGALPEEGTGRLTLAGELTLHGAAHRVTIPLRVTRRGGWLTAEGDFAVPYVAWGMADPSKLFLRVGKEVDVHLVAAGELTPAGP
jgi:polyisoprenoid-binding protein YceI